MKPHLKVALVVGVLALSVAPALALASPPVNQGTAHNHPNGNANGNNGPQYTPSSPPQAKAYGRLCNEQGASKKHVKGEKGTEFSRCVVAAAHLRREEHQS